MDKYTLILIILQHNPMHLRDNLSALSDYLCISLRGMVNGNKSNM